MSILLESLSQQEHEQNRELPDIHSSHFDDDMLGDEWIIKKMQRWRLLSIVLIVSLAASWLFFIFGNSFSHIENNRQAEVDFNEKETIVNKVTDASEMLNKEPAERVDAQIDTLDVSPVTTGDAHIKSAPQQLTTSNQNQIKQDKIRYVPQKKNLLETERETEESELSVKPNSIGGGTQVNGNHQVIGGVIDREELSFELQQKFPQIVISSYVVASNPEESFIILDGSFYQIDQRIAPDLILRGIEQDHVIVEFHSYLVKLPRS